jgi:Kef-type K+ transport system membrane component KefB
VTEAQIAPILISLATLLGVAHVFGFAAVKLCQPRFVGEILAGVLVGPFVLGRLAPGASEAILGDAASAGDPTRLVLGVGGWLGLLGLMLVSGSEVRRVLAPEQRRPTAWILCLGTAVPFALTLGIASWLPLDDLRGPRGGQVAFLVVLATAVAVTSIPVISRIFHELRILHTRFASLVLGTAMLEDIALFAALAVATALARPDGGPLASELAVHIATTVAYLAIGLLVAPPVLRRTNDLRWNVLARRAPLAWVLVLTLAYTAVAGLLEVNLVFGAFVAGFGLVGGIQGTERERFATPLDELGRVAFASVIPLYFVLVGARLDLGAGFSLEVLVLFLAGSSALRFGFVAAAARAARFDSRDSADLAVAMNARGGPGIVLATVAFDAGIIAPALFTALVITAIATSQFAGWWLGRALRDRGELLGEAIGQPKRRRDVRRDREVAGAGSRAHPAAAGGTPGPGRPGA